MNFIKLELVARIVEEKKYGCNGSKFEFAAMNIVVFLSILNQRL